MKRSVCWFVSQIAAVAEGWPGTGTWAFSAACSCELAGAWIGSGAAKILIPHVGCQLVLHLYHNADS